MNSCRLQYERSLRQQASLILAIFEKYTIVNLMIPRETSVRTPTNGTPPSLESVLDGAGFEWRGDENLLRTLVHLWKITAYAEGRIRILLNAPTGCGKELLARAIHTLVRGDDGKFIEVNCSTLNPMTATAELFGAKAGSYTGLHNDRPGYFHLVCGPHDILFLDEIHRLAPDVRPQLYRVLSERTFHRVGDPKTMYEFHGHVISAASGSIDAMRQAGEFPEDLSARLSETDEIRIPSFDARHDDHRRKVVEFGFRQWVQYHHIDVQPEVLEALTGIAFPNNIRDLNSFIKQLASYARADADGSGTPPTVTMDHFMSVSTQPRWHSLRTPPQNASVLPTFESTDLAFHEGKIFRSLLKHLQSIHGVDLLAIAQAMGIPLRTLRSKIVKYSVQDDPHSFEHIHPTFGEGELKR